MPSIKDGYIALYADDSDSDDTVDPGDSVSQRRPAAEVHPPSAIPQAPSSISSLSDITLSDVESEVFNLPPSPLYATTKTVTTTRTTTTYTYTPMPSPTKSATGDLPCNSRSKSVAPQATKHVSRGRSMDLNRTWVIKPTDAEVVLVFPSSVSACVPSKAPLTLAPTITPPPSPLKATPVKSLLAQYASPRPHPIPPSPAPAPSNSSQPPHATFARRHTCIVLPKDVVAQKIGIDAYYVVLCGQEVGIFYSPLFVATVTSGIPGARSVLLDNHKAAVALYAAALSEGLVRRVVEVGGEFDDQKVVPKAPRRPRRLSESSIWGKVTDIDGIAAQWGG